MTRNDIRVKFNKEKDLHVLQTEGTGYIHYTDDYVHWLEDIALRQANGAEQGTSNCNIPLVSESLPIRYCQQCGEPLRRNKHKTWCEHYSGNVR